MSRVEVIGNATDARSIAERLTPSQRRGLLSRDGQGAFSSAVFQQLMGLGLIDGQFWRTELGNEVVAVLNGERAA